MPPPNAYKPGTPLTVGSHRVSIVQYILEGGFAHVYSCTIDPPFRNCSTACLKRVVVPNKLQLTLLRQEVDAMKRLRGNHHIVSYIDSHALRLAPDGHAAQPYEVLLLMEYCLGKGLIDFMNTRLTNRLTEPEILSIAGQITTAVAMCHHLHPPLLHRDIKIENVLIDAKGTYKLCDFGSAVPYAPVPKTPAELALLHEDIMHHTTPQYRAPEMIDLARGFPIDDKLDIWALGVFLYKLCYYTTPFELPKQKSLLDLEHLILHCATTLRFPGTPHISPRLQNVIRCCLREDPRRRPNALQLLQEVCLMQGVKQIPDVVPYSVRILRVPRENGTAEVETKQAAKASLHLKAQPADAFASIDKSKLLAKKPSVSKARPKSAVYPALSRSGDSSASLHDLIKQHVSDTKSDLSLIRKSEDLDRGTLDFLREKEERDVSRQSTGGSLKASLKNGLRRISTGNSQRNGTGNSLAQRTSSGNVLSHQRNSSFGQKWPAKSYTQADEHLRVPSAEEPKRRMSIQRRVALLLSSKDKKPPKSASGYGKYTDQDDISAINFTDLSANASAESLSSSDVEPPSRYDFDKEKEELYKAASRKLKTPPSALERPEPLPKQRSAKALPKSSHSTPPPCPPSLLYHSSSSDSHPKLSGSLLSTLKKKPPPPKPSKPQHLKLPEARRNSDASEISLPDLDDLEKQFARRFPSYV